MNSLDRVKSPDLELVVTAILIQRQVGVTFPRSLTIYPIP